MKKNMATMGAFMTILLLSECAEKNLPVTSKKETTSDEVAMIKNKYTAAQIAQGKVIYENKCGECHDLYQPTEYSVHEWDKILPEMSRKAKLTSDDSSIVRSWLVINAKVE